MEAYHLFITKNEEIFKDKVTCIDMGVVEGCGIITCTGGIRCWVWQWYIVDAGSTVRSKTGHSSGCVIHHL